MHQLIWNRPAEDFRACILPRQTRSGPTFSLYVYTAISMLETQPEPNSTTFVLTPSKNGNPLRCSMLLNIS